MNIKKIALSVVVSATMLTTGLFAQNESENKMIQSSKHAKTINSAPVLQNDDSVISEIPTEWTKRPYENDENVTIQLCVPGADAIRVRVVGETESNYDFITIKDNITVEEIAKLSGILNNEYEVSGNCIVTTFTSDSSVIKEGFTITVVGILGI